MGFFDNLGEKLANTGKDVAAKAKEVADITKYKTEIASQESKIKTAYQEIGKIFAEKTAGEVEPEFVPYLEAITESKLRIEELKAEIQKIKGVVICSGCGAEVDNSAQFCPTCGMKIERAHENVEPSQPAKEDAAEQEAETYEEAQTDKEEKTTEE